MDKEANYITEEKRQELLAELADLKGPKRKEILEALQYAKSLGDLSENAEYHQAREDQGKLEARIERIQSILQSAQVITGGGGDVIQVGSKVIVQKAGTKEEKSYMVVGSEEASMADGKISNRSPFGAAMFGKKKGDTISFQTPSGMANYKILSVS